MGKQRWFGWTVGSVWLLAAESSPLEESSGRSPPGR